MVKVESDQVSATADTPLPSRRRGRVVIIIISVVAALLVGALIVRRLQQTPGRPPPGMRPMQGPTPVRAITAERSDMPIMLDALGTVTPLATVTIRSQIAGQLVQVAFREGQDVKKGDLLAQIDPRPYQAALAQAEAQLARDESSLANAKIDLARYEKLIEEDSVSRQQLDTQRATVNQAEATLKSDKALIDTARINLSYCRITSPIDGRIGLRKVDVGNYISVGDATGLVVVTQLHPISVIFPIPEDELPAIAKRHRAGAPIAVTVFDRSGDIELGKGTLATIDNTVDTTTGTVKLRAMFENEDEALYPNQFVNVRVLVDTLPNTIVMPTAGIQRGSEGTFVYVVAEGDIVKTRPVKLGPAHEGRISVASGLEAGERVVVDGTDRLRDGAKIMIAGEKPEKMPNMIAGEKPAAMPDGAMAPRERSADAAPRTKGKPDGGQ